MTIRKHPEIDLVFGIFLLDPSVSSFRHRHIRHLKSKSSKNGVQFAQVQQRNSKEALKPDMNAPTTTSDSVFQIFFRAFHALKYF